jgi:hypothetical protein
MMINYAYIEDLSEGLCPDAHSEVDFFAPNKRSNRCAHDNDGGRTSVRRRPVIGSRRLKGSTSKVYGYNYGEMDGYYTVQDLAKDDMYVRAVKESGPLPPAPTPVRNKLPPDYEDEPKEPLSSMHLLPSSSSSSSRETFSSDYITPAIKVKEAWPDLLLYGVVGILAILLLEQVFQMGARSAASKLC